MWAIVSRKEGDLHDKTAFSSTLFQVTRAEASTLVLESGRDPWPLWAFARHRSTEAPMRKQGRSESTSPVNQQGQCGSPSQSPLIVFKHRGPDGQWALISRNNRRLFALKMYQAVRGDVLVEVPCCIYATNDPNTFTFVLHHCRHFEAQRALLQEAARVSR